MTACCYYYCVAAQEKELPTKDVWGAVMPREEGLGRRQPHTVLVVVFQGTWVKTETDMRKDNRQCQGTGDPLGSGGKYNLSSSANKGWNGLQLPITSTGEGAVLLKLNDASEREQRTSAATNTARLKTRRRFLAIWEVMFYNKLPLEILGARNLTSSNVDQDKFAKGGVWDLFERPQD